MSLQVQNPKIPVDARGLTWLDYLELGTRAYRILMNSGVRSAAEARRKGPAFFYRFDGCGRKTLLEIGTAISAETWFRDGVLKPLPELLDQPRSAPPARRVKEGAFATERQLLALRMRRDGKTYAAIAERIGVSNARAHQLVCQALRNGAF